MIPGSTRSTSASMSLRLGVLGESLGFVVWGFGFGYGILSLVFRIEVWGKGAGILGLGVWALGVWGFRSRFWALGPVAWCVGSGVGELGFGV